MYEPFSERELNKLANKAKVWMSLHGTVVGLCAVCPHLHESEWCQTQLRPVYNSITGKTVLMRGAMTVGGNRCIEWVRHV
jgi:hypothetical protein